jgi:hypothetical protein
VGIPTILHLKGSWEQFFIFYINKFETMRKLAMYACLMIAGMLASCNDDGLDAITTLNSDFETSTDGWTAEFSEYSITTDSASLDLLAARAALPSGLDTTRHGFMLQSHNRSDDMFMYLKRKLMGLVPNGTYEVTFDIDLGTKYPENSMGAGGSPGSSIYLKVGANAAEPARTLKDSTYHFTLDKGNQSQEGKDAIILGNISNAREDTAYAIVRRATPQPITAQASSDGDLWLFVGTDSGFEGLTRLYYDRIRVRIVEKAVN